MKRALQLGLSLSPAREQPVPRGRPLVSELLAVGVWRQLLSAPLHP